MTRTVACDQCSATLRYAESMIGKTGVCPKCSARITFPPDEPAIGLAEETVEHVCRRCGRPVKPGVKKCKQCRDEARLALESRMSQERDFDSMESKRAAILLQEKKSSFPHHIYLWLIVLTAGAAAP
ncbi:MAG: hypothetical protein K1X57_20230, partial [Gemmataceae bacterium]|nr:hypothetical protein [Gemmataceae bacterium]